MLLMQPTLAGEQSAMPLPEPPSMETIRLMQLHLLVHPVLIAVATYLLLVTARMGLRGTTVGLMLEPAAELALS